jgi:hypothetical protein
MKRFLLIFSPRLLSTRLAVAYVTACFMLSVGAHAQISVPAMLEVWKRGRPSSRTNPALSGSISCEGAQRASGCAPAWDSTFIRSVSCTFETFVDSAAKRTARFCNLRTESVPGQSSETRSHQSYGPSPIRGFVPFDVDPL